MAEEQQFQERITTLLGQILELPEDSIAPDAHIMKDLGGDSWQYLEFRTGLEGLFRIIIPDGEVDRIGTVNDALQLVQEYIGLASPSGSMEATAAGGANRAPGAGDTHLGEDGTYYVEMEVGIHHTGRNNLAETPLTMLLGDMRWSHISRFTGVPGRQLVDEANDRLYPAFHYLQVRFPRQSPMASFVENDRLTVVNTLSSYGNSVMDGYSFLYPASWPMDRKIPLKNGKQAEEMEIPYVRCTNTFGKVPQGESRLEKSRPAQPGVDNIPKLAEVPDSYVLAKKAGENGSFGPPPENATPITPEALQVEYVIEPDRDLNGMGLLHFANHCMIQDMAERRLLAEKALVPMGHDLLDLRTVVSRESAFLADARQSDSILVSLEAWVENPFLADHPAPEMAPVRLFVNCTLVRKSDGVMVSVSQAEKVVFGKTLEDAGLLESLKKLAG
jgi:acyl carrier protein